MNRKSKHIMREKKTSRVPQSRETKLITVQMIFFTPRCAAPKPPKSPNKTTSWIHTNRRRRYLSRLLSHSSCASRRILSSSPCRAEEMLSSGPVRLSLRLTAAISSSSSTQEPDEETRRAAEFVMMLSQSEEAENSRASRTYVRLQWAREESWGGESTNPWPLNWVFALSGCVTGIKLRQGH